MITRRSATAVLAGSAVLAATQGLADDTAEKPLPSARREDGKPLIRPLSNQTLSDLTCAAFGINRRMKNVPPNDRRLYASVDSGFIGQNVYLFCASERLATMFRGAVDAAELGRALQLCPEQFVTFAQAVGYPQNA